jgi:hypothetical protein
MFVVGAAVGAFAVFLGTQGAERASWWAGIGGLFVAVTGLGIAVWGARITVRTARRPEPAPAGPASSGPASAVEQAPSSAGPSTGPGTPQNVQNITELGGGMASGAMFGNVTHHHHDPRPAAGQAEPDRPAEGPWR